MQWYSHRRQSKERNFVRNQRTSHQLDEGQSAPSIKLPNQDGDTVRLSDFEGERVILYFYPKAGTEGCTTESNRSIEIWEDF